MSNFILYNNSTGYITRFFGGGTDEQATEQLVAGESWVKFTDADLPIDDTKIIDPNTGDILTKPLLPYTFDGLTINADGIDEATITGIPTQTVAEYDDGIYTIDDGVLDFSTDLAGVYIITLTNELYLSTTVEVTAV